MSDKHLIQLLRTFGTFWSIRKRNLWVAFSHVATTIVTIVIIHDIAFFLGGRNIFAKLSIVFSCKWLLLIDFTRSSADGSWPIIVLAKCLDSLPSSWSVDFNWHVIAKRMTATLTCCLQPLSLTKMNFANLNLTKLLFSSFSSYLTSEIPLG